MNLAACQLVGVTKRFGPTTALKNVHLLLPRGLIFGLFGGHGSGKTTLLRAIGGLITPTSGRVLVSGQPARKRFEDVGAVWQWPRFPADVSGHEYLVTLGHLSGLSDAAIARRLKTLIPWSGLDLFDFDSLPLRYYTRRWLAWLGLAQALLHNPSILLIDEIGAGLTPAERQHVADLVTQAAAGRTVIIASAHLEELERNCTALGVLLHGRLLAPDELTALLIGEGTVELELGVAPGLAADPLSDLGAVIDGQHIRLPNARPLARRKLLSLAAEHDLDVRRVISRP